MTFDPSDLGRRRVHLPGGDLLTVRPVTPADVDGLVALYDGLSDDDRYRRFFASTHPPRSFFERLANVVERRGYGVVATVGADCDAATGAFDNRGAGARGGSATGSARIVGEASYELLPNGDGELAIAVAADQRGWLGPYLIDALAAAAATRGVPNLEADVLATNSRMLTLLRSRGYATVGSNDWATLRLVVGTAGHTPTWPERAGPTGGTDRPRVLVETPGGRWHAGAEAEAAGLQVIACSGPRGPRPRCPALAGRPCPLAAAADAIVVSNAPDDERWRAIVDAHADLHPGVPICVEPRAGRRPVSHLRLPVPEGGAALTVDDEDPRAVVELVDRLAALHRRPGPERPGAKGRERKGRVESPTPVPAKGDVRP